MATANPAMNVEAYRRAGHAASYGASMTLQGTALKTGILLAILCLTGAYSWNQSLATETPSYGLLAIGLIGGFITALVTIFMPKISPITAPIYAAFEGLALGAISAIFETRYSGLVVEAVGLSIGILLVLLFIYGTGVIRVTNTFRIGLIAATGGICLLYVVELLLSLFNIHVPFIHETGPIGIGFSLLVVVIASLNLILDFDFIERGVAQGAPRFMEWYGGFSLLVTLVWMYLEILRLLAKLRDGRS